MSCIKDVEKAILDKVFLEHVNGRPTFKRVGLAGIEVTQQARNKSNTNPRAQAMQILRSKLKSIAMESNGHIIARFNDTDIYSPVSATLMVNPNYVQYVYNTQLSATQKTENNLAAIGPTVNTNANTNIPNYAAPTVGYFEKFIQHKQELLDDYQRRLALVQKEQHSKGVTATRLKELNTLKRKLEVEINGSTVFNKKGLKQEIAELNRKNNIVPVGYYVERDLSRLKVLAESNNLDELNEAQRLVNFYQLAASWTFPRDWANPFFLKEDVYLEDANGELTTGFKLSDQDREQYETWAKEALLSQEVLTKKKKEIATKIVNENPSVANTYGTKKFDFKELIAEGKGMRDTNWLDAFTMDITNGIFSKNGILPSTMHSELTQIATTHEAVARGFIERTDKLNPTVLQKLVALGKTLQNLGIQGSTQGVYNIFLERNANNQLTGGSTYKYNSTYENEREKIRAKFQKSFDSAKLIQDYTAKNNAFFSAFKKKREWTRANQIMVRFNAIPEIMSDPEFSKYAPNFASAADAANHKAKLISVIGQREYDKQVKEQIRLLRKYGQDKESMIEGLMEEQGIVDPNLLSQPNLINMNRWVKSHSPFYGLNDYYETKFDDGDTSGNFQKYNVLVPRKNKVKIAVNPNKKVYDFTESPDKMDLNYYNQDFEKYIEADDDLYSFHELLTEAMEYVRESAPPELSREMAVNFLATLDKTSAEIITDKTEANNALKRVVPAFKQWWDKFRVSFGIVKQKDVSSEKLDPLTGKPSYKINDSFLRDNQTAIDDKAYIERTKFLRLYNQGVKQQILDIGKATVLELKTFNVASLLMLNDLIGTNVSLANIKAGNITEIRSRVGDKVDIGTIIKDYATHEIVKDNSFDLAKMIKHFTSAAAMYSARTEAMPRLELLKNYYDNIDRVQTNNVFSHIFNKRSNRNQSEGLRHQGVQQMANWWERVVLGNHGDKHAGLIGGTKNSKEHEQEITDIIKQLENVNLSPQEKEVLKEKRDRLIHKDKVKLIDKTVYSKDQFKEYAEIESLLRESGYTGATPEQIVQDIAAIDSKLGNQFNPPTNIPQLYSDKANLQEQLRLLNMQSKLGKVRTATAAYNNFLGYIRTLRLGWNLSSGITNMIEGYSSNMIIAATGEYMKPNEIYYGYHIAKLSILKNTSFGLIKPALAVKNRMLMDMFDVLMDSKNELQKSSVKTFSNKFEKFNAHALNQRVEFVNQSALMIGMARSVMIKDKNGNESSLWDAYDTNRMLKPEFRTPENIENWEELKGKEYQVFRDNLRKAIVLAHGNYDELRGMMLKSNSLGKTLAMFKTWLPQQIYWRFAVEQDDIQSGQQGFKGKYRSYGTGSAALHGAVVGATLFGPPGFAIGAAMGAGLGGAFGTSSVAPLQQLLISTKVMAKKMLGMPINTAVLNTVSQWTGKDVTIDTSGKDFDKWVGKKGFTQQDANALKSNMSDIGIQLMWLTLMLITKHFFWDDDDDQDSARRKAHNLLVNRAMQLSSQAALYTNPVEAHKTIIGSVAILSYLSDLDKWTLAVGQALQGRDELKTGVNAGESRLWNQTKKTFIPGIFKDGNPLGDALHGNIPSLGFESSTETQFNKSAWDDLFKLHISDTRKEMKEKMKAQGSTKKEIKEALDSDAPTKKFLKQRGTTRKEWQTMSQEDRDVLTEELKEKQKEAREASADQ